jgi:hypothetical protein
MNFIAQNFTDEHAMIVSSQRYLGYLYLYHEEVMVIFETFCNYFQDEETKT